MPGLSSPDIQVAPVQEKAPPKGESKTIGERAKAMIERIRARITRPNPDPDAALTEITAFPNTGKLRISGESTMPLVRISEPSTAKDTKDDLPTVPQVFPETFSDKEQQEKEDNRHPNLPKVSDYPEKMRPEVREVYEKANALAQEVKGYEKDGTFVTRARDIEEKVISQIGMPYGHYSTSQELTGVVDDLQEALNRSREGLESPDEKVEGLAERLTKMQKNITDAEKENETFPSSRELLTHATGLNLHVNEEHSKFSRDKLKNILETGILASRKYQIDTQDKSYANTGGQVVIGRDYVEYTEGGEVKRIAKDKYTELYGKGHRLSEPSREEHQLFFGSVGKGPNNRSVIDIWNPYFSNSVTFVFSKPSLYSKSQFTEVGEVELYDKDYDDLNSDSPGFHIDLAKEPMLIVVDEAIRGDFMEFVKGVDSPLWQNKGQDVNTWIQENVMFAQTGSYQNDADKLREVYKGIEARFFEKHHITISQGRFMPTGNKSVHKGFTSIYQPPPVNI